MSDQLIFVVDDEPINCEILEKDLRAPGTVIESYYSGKDVLEAMKNKTPDLILLDIMMPELDGFEVCRRIKINPKFYDVPLIFITALSDLEHKQKGLQLGAVDYIIKPFDIFEVRLRVKRQLRMRHLYLQIKKQNEIMREELMAARKIQLNLLPENDLSLANDYEFFYEYYPCENLGGDFLDITKLDDDHYIFYITDVSGHGTASSLITIYVKEFFHKFKYSEELSPAKLLEALNKSFISLRFEGRYLTIFLGILDTKNDILQWSSAGLNTMPFLINKKEIVELKNPAFAVGWFDNVKWEDHIVKFDEEGFLLLYSDAAIEVKNEDEEQLGKNGLKNIIIENDMLKFPDLNIIVNELLDYKQGVSFDDDLTLLCIKKNNK